MRCLLPSVCYLLSVTVCLLAKIYYLLSTFCLLSTFYYVPSTIFYLLSTIYCLLFVVYYLPVPYSLRCSVAPSPKHWDQRSWSCRADNAEDDEDEDTDSLHRSAEESLDKMQYVASTNSEHFNI